MHSIKSRNLELNTYINSFIDLQYQPIKMFSWRIMLLSLFVLIAIAKDYQNYYFNLKLWFSWSPILVAILCLLTLNYQSLCLGTMSYQYRHHDTPFQVAKEFPQFEYSSLINGLEHKLNYNKRACNRSYLVLFSLLIILLGIINSKAILWQVASSETWQHITLSIYALTVFLLLLTAIIGSMFILTRKRQIELMELALFWIRSASNLRYVD